MKRLEFTSRMKKTGCSPDPTWKRINQAESWSSGDTYIASVGQGYVLATSVQVLYSAMVVANDGKFVQPTLIREVLDGEGNVVPMWRNPDGDLVEEPEEGAFKSHLSNRISSGTLPRILLFNHLAKRRFGACEPIEGQKKTVQSWVFDVIQEGMRLAVTNGTLEKQFATAKILAAGKTGTAEYCDKYAAAQNRCIPGSWPTHAWTVGYAPFDDPEIAVVAYIYAGGEGASVAGPVIRRTMEAYFELKNIENNPSQAQ